MSRNDVLAAIAGLLVLGLLLMSALERFRAGGARGRLQCVSQLKQVGVAFQLFAADNNDRLPFQVAESPAYRDKQNAWRHFQSLSNDLPAANLLVCPRDRARRASRAETFVVDGKERSLEMTGNRGVSFFINLEASAGSPRSVLCGDRNVNVTGLMRIGNVAVMERDGRPGWTRDLHDHCGNVLRADGSVEEWGDEGWRDFARQIDTASFSRLLLPNDAKRLVNATALKWERMIPQ